MKFRGGNHPWEEKPANRDEISGLESSLGEETANRDEFYGWEPSLGGETSKSG